MDHVTLLGLLAAACTTIAFFPQAYKVYKTQHTRDLSMPMYVLFSIGILLWLIYGIMINNLPIIFANAVTIVSCVYILAMMAKNRGGKA
ncbi:MAG: SemiSWEET transporter [Candidatus Omnitrophica bacterium]|nr:SemiSWEET transporter [Candidatus Omnitrophota bacterium]MDD5311089.1 SemiSWEET transporter [Candidatus Omnitrophota bacterium]MDD5546413.1 SemiSWEET transporter [Candidatus Omnitrophota bacterium]